MKRVLITGAGSYVGTKVRERLEKEPDKFQVEELDVQNPSWREYNFSGYDCVYHVAGIAHVSTDPSMEPLYMSVNRDLTIEVGKKAKDACVPQLIFMSSAIVYGDSDPCDVFKPITKETPVNPSNFYGLSKVEAEIGLMELCDDSFRVAILRCPMIYGPGCKGNFPKLAKLARIMPAFPNIENRRSMLYVGNLAELVALLVDSGKGGLYLPQNAEWSSTPKLVKALAEAQGRNVTLVNALNPAMSFLFSKTNAYLKAFGNLYYSHESSQVGLSYQVTSLKESIDDTISASKPNQKCGGTMKVRRRTKRILFAVNHDVVIYNFRLELVEALIDEGYEVHISSPYGERIDELVSLGSIFHEIQISRHGTNPLTEAALLRQYRKLLDDVKPDVVLTYTVKPNIYCGIACQQAGIPYVANITGLGTSIEHGWPLQSLVLTLYRKGLRKAYKVFFQNSANLEFMIKHKVVYGEYDILPGSGVNTDRFAIAEYPTSNTPISFVTIGRIMRDKGTDDLIAAARIIKSRHPEVSFLILGMYDDDYEKVIQQAIEDGTVTHVTQQFDIRPYVARAHALVHPSWHEGMSNVCLEAASMGRPVIASDIPGCRETFKNGVSGISFEPKNANSLVDALEKFINLPYEEKKVMGLMGRRWVKKGFDRQIVVSKYLEVIEAIEREMSNA